VGGGCGGPKAVVLLSQRHPPPVVRNHNNTSSPPSSLPSKPLPSSAKTSATTPERRARPCAPFLRHPLQRPAKIWPTRNLFLLLSNSKKFSSPSSDQIWPFALSVPTAEIQTPSYQRNSAAATSSARVVVWYLEIVSWTPAVNGV